MTNTSKDEQFVFFSLLYLKTYLDSNLDQTIFTIRQFALTIVSGVSLYSWKVEEF